MDKGFLSFLSVVFCIIYFQIYSKLAEKLKNIDNKTKKYKATVIKGEGEKFNATEMSGKSWKEDASGNWYKEFEFDTPYSTILSEWGDASSWSTAKSITKPNCKLAGFNPYEGKLEQDTNFYAVWAPQT